MRRLALMLLAGGLFLLSASVPWPRDNHAEQARAIAVLRRQGWYINYDQPSDFPVVSAEGPGVTSEKIGATDEMVRHLRLFPELEKVRLSGPVTNKGLKHLRRQTRLRMLWLSGTKITDDGMAYLQNMTSLESLDLGQTEVTDDGMAYLQGMVNLRSLDLGETRVTDRGLVHLKRLKLLRALDLQSTAVTAAGLRNLEGLQWLEFLNLDLTRIDDLALQSVGRLKHLERQSCSAPELRAGDFLRFFRFCTCAFVQACP